MYSTSKLAEVASMTCLQDYVTVAPAALVNLFGDPLDSDGYKVSGEFVFTDSDGAVVTLYDWKCTSLYDGCCENPRDFWSSPRPREFHVGGHRHKDATKFVDWLKNKLKQTPPLTC